MAGRQNSATTLYAEARSLAGQGMAGRQNASTRWWRIDEFSRSGNGWPPKPVSVTVRDWLQFSRSGNGKTGAALRVRIVVV